MHFRRFYPLSAVVLVVCALAGLACAAGEEASVLVTGTVYRPDGRPAANVDLQATGDHEELVNGKERGAVTKRRLFALHTDARGRYSVRLPRTPGEGAPLPGAMSGWYGLLLSPQKVGYVRLKIEAAADQTEIEQDIHLLRGDRVKGTVLGYPGGKPIGGARVYAVVDSGITYSLPVSKAVTDRHGHFEIPAELPPDDYRVGAGTTGYGLLDGYYPPKSKKAGTRDITLRLVHDLQLTGRIVTADGKPVWKQRVQLKLKLESTSAVGSSEVLDFSVRTDARGRFRKAYPWPVGEYDRWWATAWGDRGELSVEYKGHESNTVAIRPVQSSRVEALLRLQRNNRGTELGEAAP